MAGGPMFDELRRFAVALLLAGAFLPASLAAPFLVVEVYGAGVYGYSFPLGLGAYLVAALSTAVGVAVYAYSVTLARGVLCGGGRCPEFTAAAVSLGLLVLPQLLLQVAPPGLTGPLTFVEQAALVVYIASAGVVAYRLTRLNPGSDALKLSGVLFALGFMPYSLIASAVLLTLSLPSRCGRERVLAATVLAAASLAGLAGGLETLAAPVIISPSPAGGWMVSGTRPTAVSAMELLVLAPLGVAAAAGWATGFYLLHRATRRYMVGLLGSLLSLIAAPFVALIVSGAARSSLLLLPGAWSILLALLGAVMTGIGFFLLGSDTGSLPLQVGGVLLAASFTPAIFTASQVLLAYGLHALQARLLRGGDASSRRAVSFA